MQNLTTDELIHRVWSKYGKLGLSRRFDRSLRQETKHWNDLRNKILVDYHCLGYSKRDISKRYDITYGSTGRLLKFLNVPLREKTIKNARSRTNQSNTMTQNPQKTMIQGYYPNESRGTLVWLRSSWEYLYARHLNETGELWDTEREVFTLNDGRSYLPDFFIFDKKTKQIKKIVEIKGKHWNLHDKHEHLNEMLDDIEVFIITDMRPFLKENETIHKVLNTWKQERILTKKEMENHEKINPKIC